MRSLAMLPPRSGRRRRAHPTVAVRRATRIRPGRRLRGAEELAGRDRRPGQLVALAKLPDALARVAGDGLARDRPERVAGLHAVGALGAAGAGVAGEQRPEDDGDEGDEEESSEHVFASCTNTCSCQVIATLNANSVRPRAVRLARSTSHRRPACRDASADARRSVELARLRPRRRDADRAARRALSGSLQRAQRRRAGDRRGQQAGAHRRALLRPAPSKRTHFPSGVDQRARGADARLRVGTPRRRVDPHILRPSRRSPLAPWRPPARRAVDLVQRRLEPLARRRRRRTRRSSPPRSSGSQAACRTSSA